jgi:hypothetical protein
MDSTRQQLAVPLSDAQHDVFCFVFPISIPPIDYSDNNLYSELSDYSYYNYQLGFCQGIFMLSDK